MDILEKGKRILKEPICNNCLGRQFAQLLSGYTNKERGEMIRIIVGFSIDKEEKPDVDLGNFAGFRFHNLDIKKYGAKKKGKCSICDGFFILK